MPTDRRRSCLCILPLLLGLVPAQDATTAARAIAVTVTDAQGRPAPGVPIVLGHLSEFGDSQDFRRLDRKAPALVTDAQGRLDLQVPAGTAVAELHLQALVLAEPPIRRSLAALPAQVGIQLPPTGQVRVLVYDGREQPRQGVAAVTLRQVGNQRFFDHVEVPAVLEPEGAQFPYVALGLQVQARAALHGVTGHLVKSVAGPKVARELVVIDLRQQEGALLGCRLLGLDGKPLPATTLAMVMRWAQTSVLTEVATDADGRFRWQVPADVAADPEARIVLLRRADEGKVCQGGIAIPLGGPWQGERDFGDLALQQEPPRVRARVVDADGKPVVGLRLTAPLAAMSTSIGREYRTRGNWEHDVVTDAEGRFELCEPAGVATRLPIEPHGGWKFAEPVVLGTDAAPVDVVAVRPGRIRLQFQGLPAGVLVAGVSLIEIAAMRRSGPGIWHRPEPATTGADGVLEFADLTPGKYRLAVGCGLTSGPLVLADLEVPAGGDCADPRLHCTDWDSKLRFLTVRAVAGDGKPAAAHVLLCDLSGGGVSATGHAVKADEPLRVLVPPGWRLLLQEPGYRSEVVTQLPAEVEFRLRPRPRVRLALAGGKALPAGLRVRVGSAAVAFLGGPAVEVATGGEPELVVRPEAVGRAKVSISTPVGNGTWQVAWTGAIEVLDQDDEQRVELAIPDAELGKLGSPSRR